MLRLNREKNSLATKVKQNFRISWELSLRCRAFTFILATHARFLNISTVRLCFNSILLEYDLRYECWIFEIASILACVSLRWFLPCNTAFSNIVAIMPCFNIAIHFCCHFVNIFIFEVIEARISLLIKLLHFCFWCCFDCLASNISWDYPT